MARTYRTGDYCGLTGVLTGMIFDSMREETKHTSEVESLSSKPINITININLNKDGNLNYKDLIKSIVDSLS